MQLSEDYIERGAYGWCTCDYIVFGRVTYNFEAETVVDCNHVAEKKSTKNYVYDKIIEKKYDNI